MTPLSPAQREAEEFDRALGGTATPAVTEGYADLLDTVDALRSQPEVAPRPQFVDDLRARLLAAAKTELVAGPPAVRRLPPTRSPWRGRRIPTLAASLVIVGGSAGMAAAASGSLPGDSLYPIKRGVEQASTVVRIGDDAKGRNLLDHAASRLDEVRDLQALGSPDDELTSSTIDSFRQAAESGSMKLFTAYARSGDSGVITTVRTFTTEQMARVNDLSGTSAVTDEALLDAADTLAAIDQQARSLCPTCGPVTPLSLPGGLSESAVTVDSPLVPTVAPVQVDIDATRAAAVEQQEGTAEKPAEELADDLAKGDGADPDPLGTATESPVTSTPTPEGQHVPASEETTVVTGVVTGAVTEVTDSVNEVTTPITPPEQPPLDPPAENLTDTVDEVTDGLLPDPPPCTPSPAPAESSGCP